MEKYRKRKIRRTVRLLPETDDRWIEWLDRSGLTFQEMAEYAIEQYISANPNPEKTNEK